MPRGLVPDQIGQGDRVVLHVPAAQRPELHELLDLNATLEVEDVAAALAASFQPWRAQRARALAASEWENWFQDWHPLSEIEDKLEKLAVQFGGRATLITLGTSAHGRPIRALHVGVGEPYEIVVNGCIHAREWIAASTVIYVAEWLLRNSTNSGLAWTLIPVLNVDGYEYTWTTDRLWRKNRQETPGCMGIDLNRNADIAWAGSDDCDQLFPGKTPLDAVETRVLRSFLADTIRSRASCHFFRFAPWFCLGRFCYFAPDGVNPCKSASAWERVRSSGS